jgi:hypothetical protein
MPKTRPSLGPADHLETAGDIAAYLEDASRTVIRRWSATP